MWTRLMSTYHCHDPCPPGVPPLLPSLLSQASDSRSRYKGAPWRHAPTQACLAPSQTVAHEACGLRPPLPTGIHGPDLPTMRHIRVLDAHALLCPAACRMQPMAPCPPPEMPSLCPWEHTACAWMWWVPPVTGLRARHPAGDRVCLLPLLNTPHTALHATVLHQLVTLSNATLNLKG